MSEISEFKLISAIRDKNFDQIAESAMIVLEERSEMMKQLAGQHVTLLEKLERLTTAIEEFEKGFPDGDIRGHRLYHERLIRNVMAQEDFWNGLKSDLAKKGLWAVLLIVVGLIIAGLSAKIGLPQ